MHQDGLERPVVAEIAGPKESEKTDLRPGAVSPTAVRRGGSFGTQMTMASDGCTGPEPD